MVINNTELVIKVMYGETLRRFSVLPNGNGSLDLDMAGVRAKIFDLFKFTPDADVTLTYIDEDYDVVELVDDADLWDAIKQRLNPLRINVILTAYNAGKVDKMRWVGFNCRSCHTVNYISTFGIGSLDPVSRQQLGTLSMKLSDDSKKSEDCKLAAELKTSKDPAAISEVLLNALTVNTPNTAENVSRSFAACVNVGIDSKNSKLQSNDSVSGLMESSASISVPIKENVQSDGFNIGPPSTKSYGSCVQCDGCGEFQIEGSHYKSKSKEDYYLCSFCFPDLGMQGDYTKMDCPLTLHPGVRCDHCGICPIAGPRYKSNLKEGYDLCSFCFPGLGKKSDYTIIMDNPIIDQSPLRANKVGSTQSGVAGYPSPRFPKFQYSRFEKPLELSDGLQICVLNASYHPKLGSHFIEDVKIGNGMLMTPLTQFTKIWHVMNNGGVVWPCGTHLKWTGGDRLTDVNSLDIKLPVEGCLVGMDLNIAIDFTAPEKPGHYNSIWRMALPSGQTFGEFLWVNIQVDSPQRDSRSERCQSLSVNMPPYTGASAVESYPGVVPEVISEPSPVTDAPTVSELVRRGDALDKSLMGLEQMLLKETILNKAVSAANDHDMFYHMAGDMNRIGRHSFRHRAGDMNRIGRHSFCRRAGNYY